MTPGRFDYVKYDAQAVADQQQMKETFTLLELNVENRIKSPRAKALVMTKIEEAYMWVGKAIRDDQLARNKTTELQEERSNS